jgi:fructosamine-3-kinase
MFIARMSGHPLDKVIGRLSQENIDSLEYELGACTARIHSLKGARFGYIGDETGEHNRNWRESFLNILFSLLDDAMALSVKLPAPYTEIKALFNDLSYALSEIQQPSLVHWDLWPPNIFVVPENDRYRIEGITDWDRAFWGDPEAERVMSMRTPGSPFFQGYGKELTGGKSASIRRCFYQTHLSLVMVIEAPVRFENAPHVARAYASLERDLQTLRSYLD